MNTDRLHQYVELEDRRRQLEAELDQIKEQMAKLQSEIVDDMSQAGISSMRVKDRTLYIARDVSVSPADSKDALIAALKAAGLDQYVREDYHTQSLRAYVREILRDMGETQDIVDDIDLQNALPEPLREAMRVSTFYQLRSRKS